MATLLDIYNEFSGIINDTSWDLPTSVKLMNRCIREISGQVLLPDLETIANITTSADPTAQFIELPNNYQRHLSFCHSITNNRRVKIYGSVPLLYKDFCNLSLNGMVYGIAVMNTKMYYYRLPGTPETLLINYWSNPTMYTATDIPTILPPTLHSDLLLNFLLWKSYALIEEGLDGQKVQTKYYKQEYMDALANLSAFVGAERSVPVHIQDESHINAYSNFYLW